MSGLLLPAWPAPREIVPSPVIPGGLQSTATESDDFWLNRLGARYSIDFSMKPMTPEQADQWSDLEETNATVVMRIPQPGLDIGAPGAPEVDGSGQSGSSIAIKGLTPHYAVRRKQWLSIVTGGRRYCYRARSEVVADASGEVVVPIRPMLRKPHLDGDVVEIAEPMIEGIALVADGAWAIRADDRLVYLAFTIKERA